MDDIFTGTLGSLVHPIIYNGNSSPKPFGGGLAITVIDSNDLLVHTEKRKGANATSSS